MPHTHLSQSKSRRDLAASLRGSRPRKHARLRHRRLQAERLEDRQMLATITGTVFNDLNANGLKDGGESGQIGWTVYLDADGNGQLGTSEASATTAGDGSYSFDGLDPGTYTVAEVQQMGWQQSSPVGITSPIERVSVKNDGTQADNVSSSLSISADGRYVAFSSSASNLVPDDTNGVSDIFVYDRQTDRIERVSVDADGNEGNGKSTLSAISADGRYVAFGSRASNLVLSDTNGTQDVFVYDRDTDTIERVNIAYDGAQGDSDSFVMSGSSVSADGRYVAFSSNASNLVPGDTNGQTDSFVVDRQVDPQMPHTIKRVSVANDGTQANGYSSFPSISADGHYVVFVSAASNLVPGDTNGNWDTFVYDRQMDTIERVSIANNGTQGNNTSWQGSISADGRYVAFSSNASNLVSGDTNVRGDTFVYDRQTDTIERVSIAADGTQGNDGAAGGTISADGRYVAFQSSASNLVPGDTNAIADVFVYDRQTDTTQRVGLAADGTQGNGVSSYPSISSDGRYVAFDSVASNLVPGDTNGFGDAFVTSNPFAPVSGSHLVELADSQVVSAINFGNASLATKFYVVNDASLDRTYEYNATGTSVETYGLNTGNTAPRGAASTIAGDKTWVVDANRKVYVYSNSGGLLGSWTAGTLATTATVEGIATNGTDVWIVDAKSDKVYKYTGAATRLSGSQNAASSFSLNSANANPKDIVTDGTYLWVVNDSTTDTVFKYTVAGSLEGSWTVSSGGGSPTGITLDPADVRTLWIVDNATDRVYHYNAAASRTSGSQTPSLSFALAAGNTNPQGIADPPSPDSMLATPPRTLSASASQAMDAAIVSLMGGQTKTASAKTPSTIAAKTTVDSSFTSPSPRANTVASPAVAATKSPIISAVRRGPAVRAVDHAITTLAGDDLKIESALQSLAGSRA